MIRNSYRSSGSQSGAEMLETIRKARKELNQYAPIMTEYERHLVGESIRNLVTQAAPVIGAELFAKHDQAIAGYKQAREASAKAKQAEVNRWESGKLLSEMQTAKALLDNAMAAGGASVFGGVPMASRVEAIYRDAKASGDIFRLRAVAEVMSGLQNSKDPALFHLAREAESTLHELRTTEEMLISDLAEQDAAHALQTVRDEIQSVGVELGEPMHGVFAYSAWRDELARVQQVGDEVKFYERGAPETRLNDFQPEADAITA